MTSMQEKKNSTTNIGESEELTRPRSRRRKREKPSRSVHPVYKGIMLGLLLIISLIGGLMVGYAVVGNGSALEVFDWNTYKHIYDLVFKTNT